DGAQGKTVVVHWHEAQGTEHALQGECVATATGIEGSVVYALSAHLRDTIAQYGHAAINLDLTPGRSETQLRDALARPRAGRSLAEHLRRAAGIHGVKAGLLYEVLPKAAMQDPAQLAAAIKRLPLRLLRARPVDEAISSAGGIRLEIGRASCRERAEMRCEAGR